MYGWVLVLLKALKHLVAQRISNEKQVSALILASSEAVTEVCGRLELAAGTLEALRNNVVSDVVTRVHELVMDELTALRSEDVAAITRAVTYRLQAEMSKSLRAEVLGLSELFEACAKLVDIGKQAGPKWDTRRTDGGDKEEEEKGEVTAEIAAWISEHTRRG